MLLRTPGGAWQQPPVQSFESEDALQKLIAESPQLVVDTESYPAVAVRELAVPEMGYLDVLVVRADGDLALVEAKLARNPEIRRAVIGQLLAYAGGLWRVSYDGLDDLVRSRTGRPLDELISEAGGYDPDFDAATFRRAVATNLADGNFRLVFAVDRLTSELRRVVEFLNGQTVAGTESSPSSSITRKSTTLRFSTHGCMGMTPRA